MIKTFCEERVSESKRESEKERRKGKKDTLNETDRTAEILVFPYGLVAEADAVA